jgi:hypothetical protein
MSVAVDECEERIYGVGELSVEEIAPIITETLASYGEQVISEFNLEKYVRYVAVDNPVYYLSYATSGITSLENYIDAKESSSEARNEYVSFIDSSIDPKRIAEGLRSPFNENTYKRFSETFGVNNADSTENSDGVGESLYFAPLEERVWPAA